MNETDAALYWTLKAPDYAKLERRRINKDPALSLRVFNEMKAEVADLLPDYVPTRRALCDRLLAIAFGVAV